MTTLLWQLSMPIDAIIFDCDGTLSAIEGIDELAKINGVSDKVQVLTAEAMGKTGMSLELFQQRLDLVQPTQKQVLQLGQQYFSHQVPDVQHVIRLLQRLQKKLYIVSAGLTPAVVMFGELLHIPRQHIFAVNIQFDAQGNYMDFDRSSPLVTREGKRVIVNEIKNTQSNMAYVGDGLNDLMVMDLTTRFIGYGGTFYRKNIADCCHFYINTPSMTAMLPLILTQEEYHQLTAQEASLYQHGLQAIHDKKVLIS